MKLTNTEDMTKYKDYLLDNTLLTNHFKVINYLKTDNERTKQFNTKNRKYL